MSMHLHVVCVCDGSRNMYLIIYIFGPISSTDWHQILTRLVDLLFLSHTHVYSTNLLDCLARALH